jgi:ArsR family transcriptional regulator, virulence genes transcriptional regulator
MDFGEASAFLNIMGNEVRLRITVFIWDEPKSVMEIAEAVGLEQSPISQHLRRMREAGVVLYHRRKNQRLYSLASGNTEKLLTWLETEFPANA